MDLTAQKCEVCKVGAPTLTHDEISELIKHVVGWNRSNDPDKIFKEYEFKNFMEAVGFINQVAALAEGEGHHPDVHLHDYKHVKLELWTHKINGLHKNDFILAAKIDAIK